MGRVNVVGRDERQLMKYHAGQAALHLERIRGISKRLISLSHSAVEHRAVAEGIKTITITDMPATRAVGADRMVEAIAGIEEIVAEMKNLCDEYRAEVAAAHRTMERMKSPECAAALEMHYLACATWKECAEALNYTWDGMMDLRQRALLEYFDAMPEADQMTHRDNTLKHTSKRDIV